MAHRIVNSHCPVRTGRSGALSGAPLKFDFRTMRSRVSARGKPFPGPTWPHLTECAPDSPVHTGQSGAPQTETLVSISECHLALYVSVNMHQHYTRTLLVKLLIDNLSL
jgi:hypothetical protein